MLDHYSIPANENQPQDYYWFKRGFSKEQLKQLNKDLESLDFEDAATFNKTLNAEIRKSKVKWLPQTATFKWVYSLMQDLALEANNQWNFDLHAMPENIQYTEYDANEAGHYTWHQDIGPGYASKRKVSITIQLTDSHEYEGGDLEIWQGGTAVQTCPRGAGVAVLFPSYMMHRVTPLTSGIRKSLVLWIGGSHFR